MLSEPIPPVLLKWLSQAIRTLAQSHVFLYHGFVGKLVTITAGWIAPIQNLRGPRVLSESRLADQLLFAGSAFACFTLTSHAWQLMQRPQVHEGFIGPLFRLLREQACFEIVISLLTGSDFLIAIASKFNDPSSARSRHLRSQGGTPGYTAWLLDALDFKQMPLVALILSFLKGDDDGPDWQ